MPLISNKDAIYKRPFGYPESYDYWLRQSQAHWLHTEVSLSDDIKDWHTTLTDADRHVVSGILKGFTQIELPINNYWGTKIVEWFKVPEIIMMANAFAYMETVHIAGYANLNESLPGQDDFEAFLHEPETKAKIDRLIDVPGETKADIAKSLAIFSGFAEGVQLFSSFAALLSFKKYNKLKGVGQIVAWSIRDESLHSEAGCWLFRTFIEENPELWTPELKDEIKEAARLTVKLEDEFIDKVFEMGPIQAFNAKELKSYIRMRTNAKLHDLGLGANWRRLDMEGAEKIEDLINDMTRLTEQKDFFDRRPTAYSKGVVNFDHSVFEDKKEAKG